MASSKLIGTAPDQAPSNADLGTLAFQDSNAVKITGGDVTANHYVDTAISEVKPSLLLDFANGKTLDPRITFTRSTTATYYDGRTTAMAEQNLLTYSQQFDNAVWSTDTCSVVPNVAVAPDGTLTGYQFNNGTSSGRHGRVYSIVVSSRACSFYAKNNTAGYVGFSSYNGAGYATFNLSNGTVALQSGCTASITPAANGWYRCVITGISGSYFIISVMEDATTTPYNTLYTATDKSIFVWGAQLEDRSGASAYTPTTSSPVTNYIPALQTAGGGAPRFDHDPITGESKGLLIEEQRTNLLTYSEQFNNSAWSKNNLTVATNDSVAPDGTLSAELISGVGAGTGSYMSQLIASSALTYTLSVYAKAATSGDFLGLVIQTQYNDRVGARFNLSIGAVVGSATPGGSASTLIGTSISPVGNGWYRCAVTATVSANASARWYIGVSDASQANTDPFYSAALRSVYIWGAQLEAGAFPTSYMPTTSAQVTRSGDVAYMTGTNFSSWYNNQEGTLFTDGVAVPSNARYVTISDASVTNQIFIARSVAGLYMNNAYQYSSSWDYASGKAAFAFKAGDIAGVLNGTVTANVTSGILNPATRLSIGVAWDSSAGGFINGTIKRIAYYPKRLSNAELQEMTS